MFAARSVSVVAKPTHASRRSTRVRAEGESAEAAAPAPAKVRHSRRVASSSSSSSRRVESNQSSPGDSTRFDRCVCVCFSRFVTRQKRVHAEVVGGVLARERVRGAGVRTSRRSYRARVHIPIGRAHRPRRKRMEIFLFVYFRRRVRRFRRRRARAGYDAGRASDRSGKRSIDRSIGERTRRTFFV